MSQAADPTTFYSGGLAYHASKRCFDVCLSILLLILLAPLLLVIALLIKLDSPGPVFFAQDRAGSKWQFVNGRVVWTIHTFRIIKFRSMVHNADQSLHQQHIQAYASGTIDCTESHRQSLKLAHDPRITRVGNVIRQLSLDELPQLINVLRGEMSLVGPRPVPLYEYECYSDSQRGRMAALPGITGLWQVKGRCVVSFDEQIQMDIDYVKHQSFLLDGKILLLTLPAVMSRRGAG